MAGLAALFKTPQPAPPPKPQPVVRMPDPDGPAAQQARERARRKVMAEQGRESTILTGRDAGAPAYSNRTLGD